MPIANDLLEILDKVEERKFDKFRRSNQQPTGTLWDGFAKLFDIGVLDLDNIAPEVGYEDFEDLAHLSPLDLLDSPNNPEFLDAIKQYAASASGMTPIKIEDLMRDKL